MAFHRPLWNILALILDQNRVASDSAAKKFYEALVMHAGSIEELNVNACYEDLWCFGHHNQALFSTFQNLRTLSVKVSSRETPQSSDLEDSSRQDIIVGSLRLSRVCSVD